MEKIPQIKIDLSSYLIDDNLVKTVSGAIAKKYFFMPVFKIGDTLTIATADPENVELVDDIQKALGINIEAVYSTQADIAEAIEHHYGLIDLIEASVMKAAEDVIATDIDLGSEAAAISEDDASDSSIVNLVNLIIRQALLKRASDIHIEPCENDIAIRLRVDGEMSEINKIPKKLISSIVSRIKVMGGMDIAESRLPQDGHIKIILDARQVEMRVSSLPMINGENIVMRMLPKGENLFGLEELGFSEATLKIMDQVIRSPFGIMLVTGPTGSGKTTTLYSVLDTVNDDKKNIITLEDPVEYQLPIIRQVQVNAKAGLTFSSGLRSILRQDPDIIMVGEIRDLETAELSIRSALTGHLVFSTLHTNDAPSALIRLIDMGVEPFLVSSAVVGVLAQRLVRTICKKCKIEYKPMIEEIEMLELDPSKTYYKGKGCKTCGQTGYRGRIGIYELLVLDEAMKSRLIKRASAQELRSLALEFGMQTLKHDGVDKILKGMTTPEEVLKVTQFLKTL
jgi:type IV pilus assembly protein PilB